mmetsp:Transcript_21077/g.47262  ORF Transcript_21077/g.47262 Transcript_21077/m.47262 type:complete len:252 (+) Transcript_21077:62-817(+)
MECEWTGARSNAPTRPQTHHRHRCAHRSVTDQRATLSAALTAARTHRPHPSPSLLDCTQQALNRALVLNDLANDPHEDLDLLIATRALWKLKSQPLVERGGGPACNQPLQEAYEDLDSFGLLPPQALAATCQSADERTQFLLPERARVVGIEHGEEVPHQRRKLSGRHRCSAGREALDNLGSEHLKHPLDRRLVLKDLAEDPNDKRRLLSRERPSSWLVSHPLVPADARPAFEELLKHRDKGTRCKLFGLR